MKLLIAAVGFLTLGVSAASAQYAYRPYLRSEHPYEERHHSFCQERARQVYAMERVIAEGRSDHKFRERFSSLATDMRARCGRYRYRD